MNGYKTATFPDLVVDHLKPRNVMEGNLFRRNWQLGIREYAMANHPLFEIAKCCGRCFDFPPIVGALARLAGYAWAALTSRKRFLPFDLTNYMRQEQMARLKQLFFRQSCD
jgi:hypothetical protein